MTYPLKFRQQVLSIREKEGLSIEQTAVRFGVGKASVMRWLVRLVPRPHGPRQRKLDRTALARDVQEYPDAYQYERAARLGVSTKAIWYALRQLGVSYKKNPSSPQGQRLRTAYLHPNSDPLAKDRPAGRVHR